MDVSFSCSASMISMRSSIIAMWWGLDGLKKLVLQRFPRPVLTPRSRNPIFQVLRSDLTLDPRGVSHHLPSLNLTSEQGEVSLGHILIMALGMFFMNCGDQFNIGSKGTGIRL